MTKTVTAADLFDEMDVDTQRESQFTPESLANLAQEQFDKNIPREFNQMKQYVYECASKGQLWVDFARAKNEVMRSSRNLYP